MAWLTNGAIWLVAAVAVLCSVADASIFTATLPCTGKIRSYQEVQSDNPTVHIRAKMPVENGGPLTYLAYPRASSLLLFGPTMKTICCIPPGIKDEIPTDVGEDYKCVNYIRLTADHSDDVPKVFGLIEQNFSDANPFAKEFSLLGGGTDHYEVAMYACKASDKVADIEITIGFSNWWNFLPYSRFPVLWILVVGIFMYIAFIIWYSVLLYRFWSEVLMLQKMVMLLIITGFFESLFVVSEFGYWNINGWHSPFLMVLALLLVTLKKVTSRMLFLFVAQGYGVVKPLLPNPKIVFALGLVYTIAELYYQGMVNTWLYHDTPKEERGRLVYIPVYLVDSVIMLLSISALVQTIKVLWVRKANQSEKLKIYLWSLVGFTLFIVSNILYMVLNLIESKEEDIMAKNIWKIEWINLPLLYFAFLLTLIQMATLWRPTENNMRYSYIPSSDTRNDSDEEDEWAVANDDIKMKSGLYGNLQRRRQPQKKAKDSFTKKRVLREEDDAADTLNWIEENVPTTGNEVTVAAFVLDDEDIEDMKKEIAHLD